jgi:transmembrane sensor
MSVTPLPAMNKDLQRLLDRYLSGEATEQENEQLMSIINAGTHDEAIKGCIEQMLHSASDEDMDARKAGEMLNAILSSARRPDVPVIPLERETKSMLWKWAAAAVLALTAAAGVWLIIGKQGDSARPIAVQHDPSFILLSGKQYVRLPDGSSVLLNDHSELRYPDAFGSGSREVFLTGEGYFDIQHDPARPFIVHTGKIKTTVLGTAFNVMAWPDSSEIKVTVARGKVQVGDETHTYGTIVRDQQIAVNTITHVFKQTDTKSQEVTEWKSNYLILDDMSLEEATSVLEAKYHVQIEFANEKVKACHVSATFLNDEDLRQILTVLTGVLQATYTQENNRITIDGAGCE